MSSARGPSKGRPSKTRQADETTSGSKPPRAKRVLAAPRSAEKAVPKKAQKAQATKGASASPYDPQAAMMRLGSFAHYADPAYYAHTYAARNADIGYYVNEAVRSGGPVLELGAGNGRITLPLARHGVRVCAVDHSRPMLDDLRARLEREPPEVQARVTIREGDIRDVSVGKKFARVFCPFNTALHLYTRDDVERFFTTVKRHLLPNGELVVDLSVPLAENLARDPEKPFGAPPFRHPTEGKVRYKELFDFDPSTQVLLVTMQFFPEDKTRPAFATPLAHRQYFPREWEALLHYNGFEDLRVFGDFFGAPLDRDSDVMVWHARPMAQRARRNA